VPEFVVAQSSAAAARLPAGEGWRIHDLPASTGLPVQIDIHTDYLDLGFASPVPGRLIAEVRGEADNLEQALESFGQTLAVVGPILAVAVNADVPEFEYDLAYDCTVATKEHRITQWFRRAEAQPQIRKQRPINAQLTQSVMNSVLTHEDGSRAHRACVQYQEALANWERGTELRAVLHLWMAVEALTKAFLRAECTSQGLDDDGLCESWGIEKRSLDGEVRRRLIFSGDDQCYRDTRNTSDGLEHMFQDFPTLHRNAAACRDCAARHVRAAIFRLIGVNDADVRSLEGDPYTEPLALVTLDRTLHGTLVGLGDKLARAGDAHPHFEGTWELKEFEDLGEKYDVTFEDNFTVACGDGITLTISGMGTNVPVSKLETKFTRAADRQDGD
jgi:hypothetical protein